MNSTFVKLTHNNNFNLIRLIAAFQVLIVHALHHFEVESSVMYAAKAFPGVPAFFFISGYLIFYSYHRTRERGLRAFFRNRALRIYPALLACIAVSTFVVFLTGYFATKDIAVHDFFAWIAAQSTILQFYNPEFMRDYGVGVLNGALWTISVELQFYLLTPILYFIFSRSIGLAILIAGASLLLNVYIRMNPQWDGLFASLVYVSFTPWIYMFILGAFTAASGAIRELVAKCRLRYLFPAYIASMVFVGPYETNASNAINPVSFVLLCLIVLRIAEANIPIPERINTFIRKNDLSYAIYLYHMPTINLLLFVGVFGVLTNVFAVVAAAFMFAAASWYLIEKPALSLKV